MLKDNLPRSAAAVPTYRDIAVPWLSLGHAVLPATANKTPTETFWPHVGDGTPPREAPDIMQRCHGRRMPYTTETARWAIDFEHTGMALLCLDGVFPYAQCDLVVIDVDSGEPEHRQWVIDHFGRPVIEVRTPREGGGAHLYYLVPHGERVPQAIKIIGPIVDAEAMESAIDVKGSCNYVIAPGSLHKTGRRYRMFIDGLEVRPWEMDPGEAARMIRDALRRSPELDVKLLARVVAEAKQRRVEAKHRKKGWRVGRKRRRRPQVPAWKLQDDLTWRVRDLSERIQAGAGTDEDRTELEQVRTRLAGIERTIELERLPFVIETARIEIDQLENPSPHWLELLESLGEQGEEKRERAAARLVAARAHLAELERRHQQLLGAVVDDLLGPTEHVDPRLLAVERTPEQLPSVLIEIHQERDLCEAERRFVREVQVHVDPPRMAESRSTDVAALVADSAEDAMALTRERRAWLRSKDESRSPTWSQAVRREWAQMGISRTGTFHQGLANTETRERRVHRRIPLSITHFVGGPLMVAGKIAATLRLRPHLTVGAGDEAIQVVGRSLGERGGYLHTFPDTKAWNAFRARFKGAFDKAVSQIRREEEEPSPRICEIDLPAYVVSHRPDGSRLVLCTEALPGGGQEQPAPVPPTTSTSEHEETLTELLEQVCDGEKPVEPGEPDVMEQAVWNLIVNSFRFTVASDTNKVKVEGSVASSRTLPLDPRRVYRMANPVAWVVEEARVDPELAQAYLHAAGKGYVEDSTPHTRRLSAQLQRAEAQADGLRRDLEAALGLAPATPTAPAMKEAILHLVETFGGPDLSLLREQLDVATSLVQAIRRSLVSDTSLTTVELTDVEAAALWRESRVRREHLDSDEIDELLAGLEEVA